MAKRIGWAMMGMKIVYAYEGDASLPRWQSGRPNAILREFKRRDITVIPAFPLWRPARWPAVPAVLRAKIAGQQYRPDRSPARLRAFASQIEKIVRESEPDLIFTPDSRPISFVETSCPIVFCADATFGSMLNFYPQFTNLSKKYLDEGMAQEAAALQRCSAAIYPLEWAARSAIEDHGADPSKIHVVPFGAAIDGTSSETVRRAIEERSANRLELLFVGREWHRKGGHLAHSIAKIIADRGVPVVLHVVGPAEPPQKFGEFVTFHGKLDSEDPVQRAKLQDLFLTSNFQMSMSLAEAAGLSVRDGMAHGLPSIAHDIAGMAEYVIEGETGHCFPVGVDLELVANLLISYLNDEGGKVRYSKLAHAAYSAYDANFNWSAFVGRLLEIFADIPKKRP